MIYSSTSQNLVGNSEVFCSMFGRGGSGLRVSFSPVYRDFVEIEVIGEGDEGANSDPLAGYTNSFSSSFSCTV